MYNTKVIAFLTLIFGISLRGPALFALGADGPPNVLLIISDDQRWTDYGFMGHPSIETPHLDQLASESLTFTRGYVPTSLCRPSLATIITGKYPHEHRISGNDPVAPANIDRRKLYSNAEYLLLRQRMVDHMQSAETLPRLLAGRNYLSLQTGKWWEGNYRTGGFTHGMSHGDPTKGGRHGDKGLEIGRQGLKPIFDFVAEAQEKQQPFFVWYAPFLPHSPHNPPERLLNKYKAAGRPIELARYYAMCEWFDETCGELLEYLDKQGLRNNTLVIYVSDNGWIQRTAETSIPTNWRFGFAPKSKRSPYDGGVRTPIMVRWPGVIEPRFDRKQLVSSIDIMPTVLSACGIVSPDNLPGIDLRDSDKTETRDRIFGEIFAHDVADVDQPSESLQYRWCIDGNWKLILPGSSQQTDKGELYNLDSDPNEEQNLTAAHPGTTSRLHKAIDQWWTPQPLSR